MSVERCVECEENPGENYLFIRGRRFPLCDACTEDFVKRCGGAKGEGDVDERGTEAG